MKNYIISTVLFLLSTPLLAQENSITLSGGYVNANIEDTEANGTGWRINGLYEFQPNGGKFSHGLSVGYVSMTAEETSGLFTSSLDIGSWPIYYAPKYRFGGEKIQGFIKGSVGWQFSNLKVKGVNSGYTITDNDRGFMGGGGAGIIYPVNEKIFLNAEYELLWLSNSVYDDETLHTFSLGVGFRF